MLAVAGGLLLLTALMGLALLALLQWGRPVGWRRLPGLAHGLTGVAGFAVLLLALRGPARGAAGGAGSFGAVSAWLFGGAILLAALAFLARRRGSTASSLAIGLHATLAVAGLAMLAAYLSA